MKINKGIYWLFFILCAAVVITPYLVSKDLLFPFVTTKAFYLRVLVELALPLYGYMLLAYPAARPNLKNPLTISVLVFLAINIVSAFAGVNPVRSFWGNFERMGGVFYLAHLALIYFYVLMIGQIAGSHIKRYLVIAVGACSLLALYGILSKLGWMSFIADPSLPDRVSATLGNPIFFASLLILPLFIALFFMLQAESKHAKIAWAIAALVQLVAIYFSGTRGALVGFMGGVAMSGLVYSFLHKNRVIKAAGLGITGLLAIFFVILFGYHQLLPKTFSSRIFNLNDSNTKSRVIQWGIALKGFKDYPILGTGPENYYIIANKYYNPELYQYDKSWFDKPHNFILEVLVTNGLLGFLAYAGMLIFGVAALYRAFRQQFLSLAEFSVLLCGFLAYQIQNLFVFDTVGAGLIFYIVLGFLGYLWYETSAEEKSKPAALPESFVYASAGILTLAVLYMLYLANIIPMKAAKYVNYSYAYGGAGDSVTSEKYFTQYLNLPFRFDLGESAARYSDSAISEVQKSQTDAARKGLDRAQQLLEEVVATQGNYPIYWEKLSSVYLTQDLLNKSLTSRSEDAIQKAIDLAPQRPEARMYLAQIRAIQNNVSDAERILEDILTQYPQNNDTRIQLAYLFDQQKDFQKSAQLTQEAVDKGFTFSSLAQMQGLIDYARQQKNAGEIVRLYEQGVKIEPNNINVYVGLAHAYLDAGDKEKAKTLLQTLLQADPADKAMLEVELEKLK